MPWEIVQKTYSRDHQYDGKYHIRYSSTNIHFDVICKHVNDGYKWLLYCDCPHIESYLLAEAGKIKEQQVCEKAIAVIEGYLKEKIETMKGAKETLGPHLEREQSKFNRKK